VENIDLSDTEFWAWPMADRVAAFAALRALDRPPFYAEPEFPFATGPGYYALVRHADVVEASRNPEVFCSGKGATSVADLPTEFNDFFGSMINMDDPRHARLRRIVSRAFTPRMIQKFADDVTALAAGIVDDLLRTGPCDFVEHVATKLPLTIICEEIVRYASPVMFMRRTVTRDYQMNGQDYHEGDKAVLFYWSANQDESVFTSPTEFDILRSPNPHVGFGAAGPHFCLGAHLARREIRVMLRELLTRVPDIHAAGPPDRLLSSFINGIKHVDCDFSH
jgi:cytochrome P450